jgi:hypothetical protein
MYKNPRKVYTPTWVDNTKDDNAKKEYPLAATNYSWQIYFAAIYGGLIELAQSYLTTTRKGDWIDWLAAPVRAILPVIQYLANFNQLLINII